jgi:hypothetical protein
LPADAVYVDTGALTGDALGGADETVAGDIYALDPEMQAAELLLARSGAGMQVAPGSAVGRPGAPVVPLARHQLMSERGASVELLLLETGGERLILPLGALSPRDDYTLLSSSPATGELASVAQVSFARGTRITMHDGRQVPVEALSEGDRVLTRDHGPRPVRWTGRQTVRAEGWDAAVVIAAGALGNARDLVLSPDHRLFIYRRDDWAGAGRAEVLVRARHLVDGERAWRAADGHVDYFHLLFDAHEIIYVECIPAESLLVSPEVLAGLGEDLARDVRARMSGRAHVPHHGIEPASADLERSGAAAVLRRAR